jgi:hypothetical protein
MSELPNEGQGTLNSDNHMAQDADNGSRMAIEGDMRLVDSHFEIFDGTEWHIIKWIGDKYLDHPRKTFIPEL